MTRSPRRMIGFIGWTHKISLNYATKKLFFLQEILLYFLFELSVLRHLHKVQLNSMRVFNLDLQCENCSLYTIKIFCTKKSWFFLLVCSFIFYNEIFLTKKRIYFWTFLVNAILAQNFGPSQSLDPDPNQLLCFFF